MRNSVTDPEGFSEMEQGHFTEILARAFAVRDEDLREPVEPKHEQPSAIAAVDAATGPPPQPDDWYLHETGMIRSPVYRTERGDRADEPVGLSDPDAVEQLPLIVYEYDNGVELWSRMGELNARDMLVMSYLSSAFWDQGCPADNRVRGDTVTLRAIARALGMNPQASTGLIRASIQRLSTARVAVTTARTVVDADGEASAESEVVRGSGTTGFLGNQWWRERCRKGKVMDRDNWIEIDSVMADMVRRRQFTWLKASVLRKLRNDPLALKLYAWARTHRPDDKGKLFSYSTAKLASRLGCQDSNTTRRRKKVIRAMEALHRAAPEEFPGFDQREGRTDVIVTLHRRVLAPKAHVNGQAGASRRVASEPSIITR